MNVTCPECQSVFRVDPSRVTAETLRARCSVCGGVISVGASARWADSFGDLGSVSAPRLSAAPPAVPVAVAAAPSVAPSIPSFPVPVALGGVPSAVVAPLPPVPATEREFTPMPLSPSDEPGAPAMGLQPTESVSVPREAPPVYDPVPRAADLFAALSEPSGPAAKPHVPVAARTESSAPARRLTPSGGGMARPSSPAFGAPLSAPPRSSMPTPVSSGIPQRSPTPPGGAPRAVAPAVAPPARRAVNPFLANDPNLKARRLARALVSDMVAYHPSKREEGTRNGTLKQLFRDEIKKSYEEYVEQVGRDFAESTTHFQDALNDVLASGRKVF